MVVKRLSCKFKTVIPSVLDPLGGKAGAPKQNHHVSVIICYQNKSQHFLHFTL